MLELTFTNLRHALRTLQRAPGVAFVAITSLALGIGANSALFTLMNGALFRPLPYRDAGRLVDVSEVNPRDLCAGCAVGTSAPTFEVWRSETSGVFSGLGAYREEGAIFGDGEEADRLSIAAVSSGLFELLGVAPRHGRTFATEEDRMGAPGVVVISDQLWRGRFRADANIVGRTVRLDGVPVTVVGVMPPRFQFPEFAKAWVPLGARPASADVSDRTLGVIARLKPTTSIEQARQVLQRVSSTLAQAQPSAYTNWSAAVTSLRDDLNTDTGSAFAILLGAATFVLLIACANLANLLLARAARRDREFAVRLALGASRGRLAGLLLTESLLLAVAGGAAGLFVASWSLDIVRSILPDQVPFWLEFKMDWRVLLFTLAASLVTGVVFGLAPAVHASRASVHDALKEGQRTSSASFRRGVLRPALVVGQVTLALVLLAAANLSLRSLAKARRTDDLGYNPRGILQGTVELRSPRYRDSTQVAAFATALLPRLQATPGVKLAALDRTDFLGAFVGQSGRMTLEGSAEAVPDAVVPRFAHAVSPDYFALMEIPVRRGRRIAPTDVAGSPAVVVVNEATAERLWRGADPIGRRLKLAAPGSDAPWLTVVGVVGDVVGSPITHQPTAVIYTAIAQSPGQPFQTLLRGDGNPLSLKQQLVRVAHEIDADIPVLEVSTLEQSLADWTRPLRFMGTLLGALAAIALLLATSGIYGVLSYVVAQRSHEIGVRMALGANARSVLFLIVGQGMALSLVGVAIGLTGLFALRGVLRSVLFGLSPLDPVALGATVATLVIVAGVASYVPARRVLRIDPVGALRSE